MCLFRGIERTYFWLPTTYIMAQVLGDEENATDVQDALFMDASTTPRYATWMIS